MLTLNSRDDIKQLFAHSARQVPPSRGIHQEIEKILGYNLSIIWMIILILYFTAILNQNICSKLSTLPLNALCELSLSKYNLWWKDVFKIDILLLFACSRFATRLRSFSHPLAPAPARMPEPGARVPPAYGLDRSRRLRPNANFKAWIDSRHTQITYYFYLVFVQQANHL